MYTHDQSSHMFFVDKTGPGAWLLRRRHVMLILDDFGLTPFTDEHLRDLLELLDDRHERRATIVTSQLPIKLWHETIGNGTLAAAILDRLVHNAYRIEMKGESMRKAKSKLTKDVNIS